MTSSRLMCLQYEAAVEVELSSRQPLTRMVWRAGAEAVNEAMHR